MGVLDIVLIAIIVTASVGYIAIPIIKSDDSGEIPVVLDLESISLEEEKEESYNAIKEAEFDYETGKLSDKDYGLIKEKYSEKAIKAMQKLEEREKQSSKTEEPTVPTVPTVKDKSKKTVAACAHCGAALPSDVKFCQSCGQKAKTQAQANFCPKCGKKHKKGDKFCQSCGQRIK